MEGQRQKSSRCWDTPRLELESLQLLPERFLVHHVRHFRNLAAVVCFEHVDQALNAAPRHAFVGIGGEPRDARGAGKVWNQAAAIGNGGVAQRRIGRQRFLLVYVEGGAAIQFSRRARTKAASSTTGPRESFTRKAVGFISFKVCLVEEMIGGRCAFARTQQTAHAR